MGWRIGVMPFISAAETQKLAIQAGNSITFTIEATVCMHDQEAPTTVTPFLQPLVSNRDSSLDSAPFNGPDQHRFCEASIIASNPVFWPMGTFVACPPE